MPGLVPEATGQPGGAGMGDPFGMMNSLMDFQNKANANKKFQAEFMANQAFGEIMAHAPSVEEGLNQAQANPLIAGFAQQGMLTAREIALRQAQTAEVGQAIASTKLARGKSGLEGALSSSLMAAQDPANWNKYFDAGVQGLDSDAKTYAQPKIDAIRHAIGAKIQGLNLSDPAQLAQAQKAITSLVAGGAAAAGVDTSHIAPFLPGVKVDEQGNVIRTPSPLGAAQGQAPSLMTTAPGPVGTASAGAPTPIVTNSSSGERYPLDTTGVAHYMNLMPDGKPAIGMYGRPTINPSFMASDKELQTEHDTRELSSYTADKGMLGSVAQMQAAADDLTAKGGFTVPGFMGAARGQLSNAMETLQNMTGKQFTGDAKLPEADADVATINKWHAALSFQLKNMLESTGARGLGVLMEASSAVPSMENTPLSFKVLTAGLKALANWDIGKYEFKEAYRQDPRTGGSLLGWDLAYNRVSSPLDAAKTELGKIGVVLDGSQIRFVNDEALKNAYSTGLFGKPGTPEAMNAASAMHKTMHPEQYK